MPSISASAAMRSASLRTKASAPASSNGRSPSLASALFALAVGALSLRTRGLYFIMITLAFAQLAYYFGVGLDRYGGDDGLQIYRRSQFVDPINLSNRTLFYYLCLALLVASIYLVWRIVNSRFGMVIQGSRSNDRRMQAIGFPTYRYRLVCFVIAGTLCGLAGALLANHTEFVSPAMMHWTRSGDLIVMVVLGGMASTFGPLIGAVTLLVLEETLPILIRGATVLIAHAASLFVDGHDTRRTDQEHGARARILADRAGPAVPSGRAVRARRHQRIAGAHAPWLTRLLEIDGLTKRFGGVVASDGITLSVPQGELHAIIGPNGAGKTTLIGELDRRDRARRRPRPLRRQRHHGAAGPSAQRARARALVPDHVAVQRFHRARQRGARRAGAQRTFVPVLARRPQGSRPARARARDAGARRPRRARGRDRRRT